MKAISRNEKYLSKLSGEEEVVPKPISRKEKYMYRACGYIDKPIPEHAISREEKYWKKIIENGGGGSAVLTSKDITENGLYNAADDEADGYSSVNVDVPNTYLLSDEGKVVSNGALVSQISSSVSQNGVIDTTLIDSVNVNVPNINNILFTPPQKFKSNGSNLLDYKIYGNNTPHIATSTAVLPLTFTTTEDKLRDWEIRGNDETGTENILNISDTWITAGQTTYSVDGQTFTVTGNWYVYMIIPVERNTNYYVDFNTVSSTNYHGVSVFGVLNGELNNNDVLINRQGVPFILTTGEREQVAVVFYSGFNTVGTSVYDNIMLVKGSTAPDHYIPYQQGVGERTVNEYGTNGSVSVSTVSAICNGSEIAIQSDGTNTLVSANYVGYKNNFSVSLSAGDYGYKIEREGTTTGIVSSIYDSDNTAIGTSQTSGTFTLSADKSVYIGFYIPANTTANGTVKLIITKGSTAPSSYVPFGYEIPISVSHNMLGNAKQGTYETDGFTTQYTSSLTTEPVYLEAGTYIYHTPDIAFSLTTRKLIVDGKMSSGTVFTGANRNMDISFNVSTAGLYTFQVNLYSTVTQQDLDTFDSTAKLTQPTNYTFYIGSSPLTAGQSISKTSTGVDIATQAGSNAITTSLYNKPEMSITGLDYVGVGEPVNDSQQIPVKINSTTTNVPIDAPLVENEYVSYIDQKIYHYIDGTLTPVDPPSTLPHIATANGVNELSIDVEVQPELVGIGLGNPIELVNT